MVEYIIDRIGPFDVPGLVARRWVRVYVPPGAPSPPPVLFVFDGQNVFHDAPSYAGGWHLHRSVSRLAQQQKPAPVVVGIDHGGESRIDELSPFSVGKVKGCAEVLVDWMVRELVPRVAHDYGVARAQDRVIIGGSSMGGLAALFAHFRHPETFGAALCMSPSFWLGGGRIFEFVENHALPASSRIYLDAGENEPGAGQQVKRMADVLRAKNEGRAKLRVVIDKRGKHSEVDWRRRAPAALRFLLEP